MNNTFEAGQGGRMAAPPPGVRPIRIGLLWHSANSGNLGVGALTVADMAILREAAAAMGLEAKFTIIQMRDGEIAYVDDQEAAVFVVDTRALIRPSGVWSVIGAQDCLVDIGAGDSFTDIYGAKRFGYLWLTKAMAILRGRPLLLAPQTIGPFSGGVYKALARFVLERAAAVVARDEMSLKVLGQIAPAARGLLSADVAFALPYEDRSAEAGGSRLRVGINVSGLLQHTAEQGRNQFGLSYDYASFTRRLVGALSSREDIEVHLISHVVSRFVPEDDDGAAATRLHAEFPATVLGPQFAGPSEAKSYISSLDFLVAARMHACIAAVSSGVPVVPVAYSRKFTGLFGMLDYPWILPVAGVDEGEAVAFVEKCLSERGVLAAQAHVSRAKAEGMLEAYRAAASQTMRVALLDSPR